MDGDLLECWNPFYRTLPCKFLLIKNELKQRKKLKLRVMWWKLTFTRQSRSCTCSVVTPLATHTHLCIPSSLQKKKKKIILIRHYVMLKFWLISIYCSYGRLTEEMCYQTNEQNWRMFQWFCYAWVIIKFHLFYATIYSNNFWSVNFFRRIMHSKSPVVNLAERRETLFTNKWLAVCKQSIVTDI